ncbi:response regulator transcription factor [Anaerolineae bacterium CFX9]|jgi:DNA-binding response OmpR family regulator|nr:response regulator transcription factor [Geitlerinema splendidum]MDL1902510.1 response regulator transcription factor [Anaerolineae bacterium CFX9]
MYQIMIVDDDAQILDMVELVLKREGYQVLRAFSPRTALDLLVTNTPDLIVIDAVLPDMDGITLCRKIRAMAHTASTPIIFLTGYGSTQSMVEALQSGGDDYIRKPFAPRELAARVKALLRRAVLYSEADAPVVRIVVNEYRTFVNDREIPLTRVEFDLFKFMCMTPNHLHSAETLLENVWKYPGGVGDAALVRNHIRNIRRKIEPDADRPTILQSRHGRGYTVKARTIIEDSRSKALQSF